MCFKELKRGWTEGCRPIIGLNSCFLKTVIRGRLLFVIRRDGNNYMYPIAWAIVENENTASWG